MDILTSKDNFLNKHLAIRNVYIYLHFIYVYLASMRQIQAQMVRLSIFTALNLKFFPRNRERVSKSKSIVIEKLSTDLIATVV